MIATDIEVCSRTAQLEVWESVSETDAYGHERNVPGITLYRCTPTVCLKDHPSLAKGTLTGCDLTKCAGVVIGNNVQFVLI